MTNAAELARRIVGSAVEGEQVEVCVGRSVRTEVRVHGGEVESLTLAETAGVGVRLIRDAREGVAHAGTFDLDVVDTLLAEARDNATFAQPDDRVGLAVDDRVDRVAIDPWSAEVEATPVEAKIGLALQLEARCRALDRRVRGVRTSIYGDSRTETAVVSSLGIDASRRATSASLSTSVLIDDVEGSTRTGAAVEAARTPGALDPDSVAAKAVARGIALVGAGRPRTGRPLIVLEPRFAATILGIVAGMLSGERVVKGRSPFSERVGEAIAATDLTMFDNPTDPDSLGAAASDGEGLACRTVPLISAGRLDGFLHDSRSGRGLGVGSTGSAMRAVRGTPSPGHRSLRVAPGRGDLECLVAGIDDGLLIASLQGLHSGVNAVSGDLSVGVEGVVIRNGELAEPIREGTLAGAIPRLLQDIVAIGADLQRQPGGAFVPSLVMTGLTVGGAGG